MSAAICVNKFIAPSLAWDKGSTRMEAPATVRQNLVSHNAPLIKKWLGVFEVEIGVPGCNGRDTQHALHICVGGPATHVRFYE